MSYRGLCGLTESDVAGRYGSRAGRLYNGPGFCSFAMEADPARFPPGWRSGLLGGKKVKLRYDFLDGVVGRLRTEEANERSSPDRVGQNGRFFASSCRFQRASR
jgi:hypothetical protein